MATRAERRRSARNKGQYWCQFPRCLEGDTCTLNQADWKECRRQPSEEQLRLVQHMMGEDETPKSEPRILTTPEDLRPVRPEAADMIIASPFHREPVHDVVNLPSIQVVPADDEQ